MKITATKNPRPRKIPAVEELGFCKYFTDHMFLMNYDEGQGWHDARIVPYGPLSLDPASSVLHYAQEIFEGLKAYRTAAGIIQLFRPDCNARRMQDSARRMCIPAVPEDDFVQAVKALEEVFGTGTAAVVSPVKELRWKDKTAFIGGGKIGPVTQRLYDAITGVQWGKVPDTKGWSVPVCQG